MISREMGKFIQTGLKSRKDVLSAGVFSIKHEVIGKERAVGVRW